MGVLKYVCKTGVYYGVGRGCIGHDRVGIFGILKLETVVNGKENLGFKNHVLSFTGSCFSDGVLVGTL